MSVHLSLYSVKQTTITDFLTSTPSTPTDFLTPRPSTSQQGVEPRTQDKTNDKTQDKTKQKTQDQTQDKTRPRRDISSFFLSRPTQSKQSKEHDKGQPTLPRINLQEQVQEPTIDLTLDISLSGLHLQGLPDLPDDLLNASGLTTIDPKLFESLTDHDLELAINQAASSSNNYPRPASKGSTPKKTHSTPTIDEHFDREIKKGKKRKVDIQTDHIDTDPYNFDNFDTNAGVVNFMPAHKRRRTYGRQECEERQERQESNISLESKESKNKHTDKGPNDLVSTDKRDKLKTLQQKRRLSADDISFLLDNDDDNDCIASRTKNRRRSFD